MRILITTFSFPSLRNNSFDGKFVLAEAIAYAENGAEVKVLTPHYAGVPRKESIEPGVEVIRIVYFLPRSLQRLKKPGQPLYNQKSFLAYIQIPLLCIAFALSILKHAPRADLIHAQWTVTALLALPAKWLFGTRIVLTARGSDIRLLPKRVNRFIHSQVDAAIDCYGSQPWNETNKINFPAHYIKLPLIVHSQPSGTMPIDMRDIFKEKKESTFIILYVGRFVRLKMDLNHLPLITLIHSSAILRNICQDFHVFFIGDGEPKIKNRMISIIQQKNLNSYISLLGIKTNVIDYMQFCHLGVGGIAFNTVSQEFSIAGKPQILIEGDDNDDTPWRHGVNAIFTKPNDAQDLADKIHWAMQHPDSLQQVVLKAKSTIEKYVVNSTDGGKLYLQQFSKIVGS